MFTCQGRFLNVTNQCLFVNYVSSSLSFSLFSVWVGVVIRVMFHSWYRLKRTWNQTGQKWHSMRSYY